AVD
ncbi:transketolase 1, partial [Vibrio cholerae HC-78A1]